MGGDVERRSVSLLVEMWGGEELIECFVVGVNGGERGAMEHTCSRRV